MKKNSRVLVNHEIRAKSVRCIDHDNNNLGVIPFNEALKKAKDVNLDLVLINWTGKNNPPICKILDSGKYKYEKSKKEKELAKKQRDGAVKTKEVKFRPCTDINDLKTKAKQAEKFLDDGSRVKVTIQFKGREMSHLNVADGKLNEFLDLLGQVVMCEAPLLAGKSLSCVVSRKEIKKAG